MTNCRSYAKTHWQKDVRYWAASALSGVGAAAAEFAAKAPLLRPGRAKVVQEVKVRAAKSKEAEIVGLLREGMFVTVHEVCTKSAHVEYAVTGLTGWVTLSKNSEPVLKEDAWAPRPSVKKVPRASEPHREPCEKAAGTCAGDHRSLPESAWKRIHQKFQQPAPSSTSPSSTIQDGEAIACRANWSGDHRSLPESAWKRIHQKFQQTAPSSTSPSSTIQDGEAIACRANWSGDHRSLPESAWKRIHQKFQQTASSSTSPSSTIQDGEAIACRADWSGDHRSLPESAWNRIHEAFDGPRRPEPAAASGWWMLFWQQAMRDMCCSR
ncbi:unnamed protein product [Symbiodinium necroappetens]|uniref:SH3 domain-containing protein n=1 Tax=Symbiodinium necroappetens TaxID=1628268 RepID=A0A813CE97_9DINO|nr:unnamed protein product [Symbiodinium necroappetens]